MSWGWRPVPVTRFRPVMVDDGHRNKRPDFSQANPTPVGSWLWAPSTAAEDVLEGRERGVKVAGVLYGAAGWDVQAGDVVQFEAGRFRLVGEPQRWNPGTVLEVERWDG